MRVYVFTELICVQNCNILKALKLNTFSQHSQYQLPSNKKFGLFFTAIFLALALYSQWKANTSWVIGSLVLAVVFATVTALAPKLLTLPNKLWFSIGELLGKITSPIVLGIMYFLLITPIAIVTRKLGRDVLLIKRRDVNSYWVERSPVGPSPDSFKNQF